MLRFLEHQEGDGWIDTVLRLTIRLIISGFAVIFGYLLAFGATMGPPIAPHIWDGGLDWGIRLSVIAIGFVIVFGALSWLIFPLLSYLIGKIKRIFTA